MRNILDTRGVHAGALFAALAGATLLGGCAVDGASAQSEQSQAATVVADQAACGLPRTFPELSEDQEYSFFNDRPFTFRFPGFFSAQAETFFIWNLGTSIQHGAPYPSNKHAKLWAIFAPGPPGTTHHVDGQDGFDHYHVMSAGEGTQTFDVFLVFQGPNFNAATWHPLLSEREMNAAVAAGVLNPPETTSAAGFGPLVIKVPVSEFDDHGHGH
jgi:hypothetical protein